MAQFGINAAFSAGAQLPGRRRDPYLAFNFLVEIEGLLVGGFSEVTGLEVQTEVEEYREGGLNEYSHKLAGPTHYPTNLTLKRGLTDIETLWLWHQEVVQGHIQRRNGTLYLLDQMHLPIVWWNFHQAYPVRWHGPEMRAEGNQVAVESVELVHQGLSKPILSSALAHARGVVGSVVEIAKVFG